MHSWTCGMLEHPLWRWRVTFSGSHGRLCGFKLWLSKKIRKKINRNWRKMTKNLTEVEQKLWKIQPKLKRNYKKIDQSQRKITKKSTKINEKLQKNHQKWAKKLEKNQSRQGCRKSMPSVWICECGVSRHSATQSVVQILTKAAKTRAKKCQESAGHKECVSSTENNREVERKKWTLGWM